MYNFQISNKVGKNNGVVQQKNVKAWPGIWDLNLSRIAALPFFAER